MALPARVLVSALLAAAASTQVLARTPAPPADGESGRALFEAGVDAYERGRHGEAARLLQRALDWEQRSSVKVYLAAALAHQAECSRVEGLVDGVDWSQFGGGQQLRMAISMAFESRQRCGGPSQFGVPVTLAWRAGVYRKLGMRKEWEADARELLRRSPRCSDTLQGLPQAELLAEARFLLAEERFRDLEVFELAGSLKEQGEQITRFRALQEELRREYAGVASCGMAAWSAAAAFKAAMMSELFSAVLLEAEVPKMDAEVEDIYRSQVEDVAAQYRTAAKDALGQLVEKTPPSEGTRPWIDKAREALKRYSSSAPSAADSRYKAAVAAVFKRRSGAAVHCYEKTLKAVPDARGRLTVRVTVAAAGNVVAVQVPYNSTGADELAGCIAARVAEWPFPQPSTGAGVTFEHTFVFDGDGRRIHVDGK